ncbi:hypothetical protein PENSPDRAFT_683740 [Peniophora sp. CONT]|nr:hypothetical protein PENSPDRAFT_683740 [Peniophora sp. CONT]
MLPNYFFASPPFLDVAPVLLEELFPRRLNWSELWLARIFLLGPGGWLKITSHGFPVLLLLSLLFDLGLAPRAHQVLLSSSIGSISCARCIRPLVCRLRHSRADRCALVTPMLALLGFLFMPTVFFSMEPLRGADGQGPW